MIDLGLSKMALIGAVALIVIGPKRLPEVGKSLGKGMREFKDSLSGDRKDEDEDVSAIHQAK